MIYKKYIFLVVSFLMMVFSISSALAVDDIISINGACGSAINQQWSTAPNSNLCAQGTAGTVQFLGSDSNLAYNWRWSCTSSNGGSSVDCGASKIIKTTSDDLKIKSLNLDKPLNQMNREELLKLLITLLMTLLGKN